MKSAARHRSAPSLEESRTAPAIDRTRRLLRRLLVVVSAGLALTVVATAASAAAPADVITVRVEVVLRFAGSNIQCLVLVDGADNPFDIDCFVDKGSRGQFGSYHVALDGLNQVSMARTIVTGVGIPGGAPKQLWSDPIARRGDNYSFGTSRTFTVHLGENVAVGSTPILCHYGVSKVIDRGAAAVACTFGASGGSDRLVTTDDLFRATPTSSAATAAHTIYVSDRIAAVLRTDANGQADELIRRRHFA